jgi:hypothetical protein
VTNAAPQNVNRAICYCDDCQAFLHHLGRTDLLDPHAGTDIIQVAPSALTFPKGGDRIVGLRLSPKGLYRWYASCCKTPMGNTVGPGLPFVGIAAQAFENPDEMFGKPTGSILGKFAIGTPPPGSTQLDFKLMIRAVGKMLGWKLRGKTWPHPYFDRATRQPNRPVTIMAKSERESLQRFCGPHPTGQRA